VQSSVEAPLLNIILAAFRVRRRVADLFSTAIPARAEGSLRFNPGPGQRFVVKSIAAGVRREALEGEMTITGPQVKAARLLLGWTQDKLAVEVRVSPATIGHFESGRRQPSALIANAIKRTIEAVGVEFDNDECSGVRLRKAR
jgi:DNA-binding XRE family transcriptional regulator